MCAQFAGRLLRMRRVSLQSVAYLCDKRSPFLPFDVKRNYFEVFKLPTGYDISTSQLADEFKSLQRVLHPDKFANSSEDERERSAELSSLVNRAYNTLLDPHKRGIYLLKLTGVQIAEDESEVQLDAQFLETMMDLNERLSARELSRDELNKLNAENRMKLEAATTQVAKAFRAGDLVAAKQALAELKFYKSLAERIKERL